MTNQRINKVTDSMPEASTTKGRLLEKPFVHISILVVIALFAYSNTLQVPFILDDEGSIQLNPAIHGLMNFFNGGYNFLPNRVLGYLTFAINYHFSELNVVSYHVANILIHIATALLVYFLVRITFRTPHFKSSFIEPHISMFAFVVALLFVSHPIQTQAVTYIVQRLTSLSTLLYIASLASYSKWRLERVETAPLFKGVVTPWYVLSLLAAILAMKTKEIAFTLPVIILLYEYSFFGQPGRKLLAQITPLLLTMAIIPYTVFSTINPLIQPGGSLLSDLHSPAYNVVRVTRWEYIFTQFSVIVTYLRLLLFPINQNLDYDYQLNHTLFEPRTLFSLMTLLALLLLAFYLFIKSTHADRRPASDEANATVSSLKSRSLYRVASFGIFWFFITLSVESSVITIQDVIFEHRLYLPSYGFFLTWVAFGALGIIKLEKCYQNISKVAFIVVAAILLILSSATYARNDVWRDWISIWSDTISKSPDKPRAHNVLGIGYYYSFRFDEAMREYQEAVRLKPDYIESYYNMGLIYKERKQYAESLTMFIKVLNMSAFNADQFANTYNEIGINYAELGEPDQAVAAFAASVKLNPETIEYRNNYAYALWMKGNFDDALREYQTVVAADPGNSHAINSMIEINTQKAGSREKRKTTSPKQTAAKFD